MTPLHGRYASIGLPQLLVMFVIAILLFGVGRLQMSELPSEGSHTS